MTASMTSFGRVEESAQWGHVIWEIRSVNHRYLEISLRLPEDFRQLESKVREIIGKKIKRGKVDCQLRFNAIDSADSKLAVNNELAAQVIEAAENLQGKMDNPAAIDTLEVLRWPGVIERNKLDLETISETVLDILNSTLDIAVETRLTEGDKLKTMIDERCLAASKIVKEFREHVPELTANLRDKLKARVDELCSDVDAERLEQELAFLAQKFDVAEELDRLDAHITEVTRVLQQDKPVGRRLDFLMQELNREANTLGSKAADINYTNASVELKVLIEQMREQIQNIE